MSDRRLYFRFSAARLALLGALAAAAVPAPAAASTPCALVVACLFGINSSVGPGVEGQSAKGDGVDGRTMFASTSAATAKSGVAGVDLSSSKFNFGLFGFSPHGSGLHASTDTGTAVYAAATSASGVGLSVTAPQQALIAGLTSTSGTALYAHDSGGLSGTANAILAAAAGDTIVADTTFGYALDAAGGAEGSGLLVRTADGDGIDVTTVGEIGPGIPINVTGVDAGTNSLIVAGTSNGTTFNAMGDGDLAISGTLTTGAVALAQQRTDGRYSTTYAARDTQPTAEDFGEAHVVGGTVAVPLDPKFAATIDGTTPYFVFLTPEGDSRGLFVAAKTARGFVIRESQNGRSSLAVQYRIVAKPLAAQGARLADLDTTWRIAADAHRANVLAKQQRLAAANARLLGRLRAR